jgi:hypothetical protein
VAIPVLTEERKAAQKNGREVAQAEGDAYETASGVGGMLLVNRGMTAFWRQSQTHCLPLFEPSRE